jgi:glycosyltransferase involved in cell wall biosynthesis
VIFLQGRNQHDSGAGKNEPKELSMISVVVPVYNEEEIIPLLHDAVVRAMSKLRDTWEVVYVNDGSTDSTLQLLRNLQLTDTHVVVVDLSRNWGHMGAISAGLQTAGGDAVVLMDGDLQDPPDVVPELVEAWRRGAQVVTAVRRTRQELLLHLVGELDAARGHVLHGVDDDLVDGAVDPVDDTTFWHIGEYRGTSSWQTWVGSFTVGTQSPSHAVARPGYPDVAERPA